jgi:hypothetical protein
MTDDLRTTLIRLGKTNVSLRPAVRNVLAYWRQDDSPEGQERRRKEVDKLVGDFRSHLAKGKAREARYVIQTIKNNDHLELAAALELSYRRAIKKAIPRHLNAVLKALEPYRASEVPGETRFDIKVDTNDAGVHVQLVRDQDGKTEYYTVVAFVHRTGDISRVLPHGLEPMSNVLDRDLSWIKEVVYPNALKVSYNRRRFRL